MNNVARVCLSISLAAFLSPAFAGEVVERFNADLGFLEGASDAGNTARLFGALDIPMGPYAGSRITQSFRWFRGDDNYADDEAYETGLGFFAGHHNIGRVGVDYRTGEREIDFEFSSDVTVETDTIRQYIEGYAGPVTLSYWRDDIEQDADSRFFSNNVDISAFSVSAYPVDDLRLGIGDYGADAADIKWVDAEYQIGRIASLYARYSDNADNSDRSTVSIGVTFYIRGGSTLIENDRHY